MRAVIDTNIVLVANGAHPAVSYDCREKCVSLLSELVRRGTVVIDDGNEIVEEYLRRTRPHTGNRAGDAFLKWLLNNQGNGKRVERVAISSVANHSYAELDALNLPIRIDPSDRKFVAVAAGAASATPIWEATDCKWLDWWQALEAAGLKVEFACPVDVARFYLRKFPKRASPRLPE